MNRKTLWVLLTLWCCVILLLAAGALGLYLGWFSPGDPEPSAPSFVPDTTPAATEPPTTQPPTTEPPTTESPTTEPVTTEPPTEPEPTEILYQLTFAGDCTLGTMYEYFSAASCFPALVGDNYDYPFANVQPWFAADDFTMVNLEGPLTNEGTPAQKRFAFRGDPKHANVLSAGSVEFVSLANNHSMDFGTIGYENTKLALDGVGVAYAGDGEARLVETERGLKLGVLAVSFSIDTDYMSQLIADLRDQGAEIVIVSFHWGVEGYYHHTYDQQLYAYAAIDAGADIIFGHHPHVLQEVEEYNGGIIYYSLGNFAFGGNDNPRDYDTALISQQVIRDVDGTVRLGECTVVPCSISSVSYPNNFQPTPAEPGSEQYERVMAKLQGSFSGPDLDNPYGDEDAEETTEATETTQVTEITQVPDSTEAPQTTEAPTEPTETAASTA